MVIYDEVIEEFFKELEGDEEFPDAVFQDLKDLWRKGELASREKIFEAVELGWESAGNG